MPVSCLMKPINLSQRFVMKAALIIFQTSIVISKTLQATRLFNTKKIVKKYN